MLNGDRINTQLMVFPLDFIKKRGFLCLDFIKKREIICLENKKYIPLH